mmetsp:Transcript_14204/g.37525  ORF Transcript_14204/g.37525 Transcript_14204/m.37525 type:complete len:388 (-) Transcript_14204:283-1446(-)
MAALRQITSRPACAARGDRLAQRGHRLAKPERGCGQRAHAHLAAAQRAGQRGAKGCRRGGRGEPAGRRCGEAPGHRAHVGFHLVQRRQSRAGAARRSRMPRRLRQAHALREALRQDVVRDALLGLLRRRPALGAGSGRGVEHRVLHGAHHEQQDLAGLPGVLVLEEGVRAADEDVRGGLACGPQVRVLRDAGSGGDGEDLERHLRREAGQQRVQAALRRVQQRARQLVEHARAQQLDNLLHVVCVGDADHPGVHELQRAPPHLLGDARVDAQHGRPYLLARQLGQRQLLERLQEHRALCHHHDAVRQEAAHAALGAHVEGHVGVGHDASVVRLQHLRDAEVRREMLLCAEGGPRGLRQQPRHAPQRRLARVADEGAGLVLEIAQHEC